MGPGQAIIVTVTSTRRRPGPANARTLALAAAAVATASAVGLLLSPLPQQGVRLELHPVVLALAFGAGESLVVRYQFRREQFIFSLVELPLILALFFASGPAAIAARLVGSGVALGLVRRQSPLKVVFNLSTFALETSVAFAVFQAVARTAEPTIRSLAAALLGAVAGSLAATSMVLGVITIHDGRQSARTMVRLGASSLVVTMTNSCVALVSVVILWNRPEAGWLLVVVGAILFAGYRSYAGLQQKHDDLELLYDFTRRTGRALQVDSAMRELLGQIRTVLRADLAAIVVRSSSSDLSLIRTSLSADEQLEIEPAAEDRLWTRMEASGRALLAAAPIRDDGLREDLARYGAKDALVSPLRRSDGTVLGLMVAANRLGDQRTFTEEDLKLFEALANHASVSLENRHLIERLRAEAADKEHQALHDSLTGLPNRMLFQQRVSRALAAGIDSEAKVGVMLLDLDRFKEVNDTLGHHNGDLLLQEIGDRLRRILRAGDTVARLGGDEFAVLLPDLAGEEAAMAAAEGIRHALERPFVIADVNLDVGCSIGVAMWPDHGDDAAVLLQRADVAMYSAKDHQKGVDVYDPARDTYSLERLAMVGELRAAIERGELAVHYQPKADVSTGRLLGMEALVRWEHPRRGSVPPEELIGIAEQTGLIRPLTLWVLNQALRQCRSWRRAGHSFDVAVNLSIRNLLDAELPTDVLRLLSDLGLPASCLTFEITESSIMSDPVRSLAVLGRLREMGVHLAIDDFGTGYSSFSHLRRLPVNEIKIDKSFVQHLGSDESDLVIVRSIVDLGRNLGLRVVAEGVEDDAAWRELANLGCDVVQGYVLTYPLSGDDLDGWLAAHGDIHPAPVSGDVLRLRNPAFRRT
jgi:diguanylate cyclase (GGDEF)-like protein